MGYLCITLTTKESGIMKNNKALILIIIVVGIVLLLSGSVFCVGVLGASQSSESETLLAESISPSGTYSVKAYRTNPGATIDFSIRCYVVSNNYTGKIYDAYHEATVKMEWISEDVICINGRNIDLSKRETYLWHKN